MRARVATYAAMASNYALIVRSDAAGPAGYAIVGWGNAVVGLA